MSATEPQPIKPEPPPDKNLPSENEGARSQDQTIETARNKAKGPTVKQPTNLYKTSLRDLIESCRKQGVTVQENYSTRTYDRSVLGVMHSEKAVGVTNSITKYDPDTNVIQIAEVTECQEWYRQENTVCQTQSDHTQQYKTRELLMYDTGSPLDIQSNLHNMEGELHVVPQNKYPSIGSFKAGEGDVSHIRIEGYRTECWQTDRGPHEQRVWMLVYGESAADLNGEATGYSLLSANTTSKLGLEVRLPRTKGAQQVQCIGKFPDGSTIKMAHVGEHFYMPPAISTSISITPRDSNELAAMMMDNWSEVYIAVDYRNDVVELRHSATPNATVQVAAASAVGVSNNPQQFPTTPQSNPSVERNLLKWCKRFACISPLQVAKILKRAGIPRGSKGDEYAELYKRVVGKIKTSTAYRKKPRTGEADAGDGRQPSVQKVKIDTGLIDPFKQFGTDSQGPFPTSRNQMKFLAMFNSGDAIKYYPKQDNTAKVHLDAWTKFNVDFSTKVLGPPGTNPGVKIKVDQGVELKGAFKQHLEASGIKIEELGRHSAKRYANEGPHNVFARMRQSLWRINRDKFLRAGYQYNKVWDHIALAANLPILMLPSAPNRGITRYESLFHVDLDADLLQRICPANIGDTVSVINPKAARPSKARANKTLRRNGEFGELAPRNMLALYLRIIDHHPHGNNVHEVLVPGQGVMKVGIEHITFYENESTTPMLYDADDPLTTNDIDKDVKGLRMQYERSKAEAKSKVSNKPEHNEASTDDDLTARTHKPNEFTYGSGKSGNVDEADTSDQGENEAPENWPSLDSLTTTDGESESSAADGYDDSRLGKCETSAAESPDLKSGSLSESSSNDESSGHNDESSSHNDESSTENDSPIENDSALNDDPGKSNDESSDDEADFLLMAAGIISDQDQDDEDDEDQDDDDFFECMGLDAPKSQQDQQGTQRTKDAPTAVPPNGVQYYTDESDSEDEWYDADEERDDPMNNPTTFDSLVGEFPLHKPRQPRWQRRQEHLRKRNEKWDPRVTLPRDDAAYDGLMAVMETIIFLAVNEMPWSKTRASDIFTPRSVPEALKSEWGEEWHKAMEYEKKKHRENDVFEDLIFSEAVRKYGKRRVHTCKYVFKVKPNDKGFTKKFRARYCVQGHRMVQGWDYFASYAAVPRPGSWKIVLAIAAQLKLCVKLIDVESAFLNSDLEPKEYVFVRHPEGVRFSKTVPMDDPRRARKRPPPQPYPDEVISVAKKALNGSPASPRAWAKRLHKFFQNNKNFSFTRSWHDPCCYVGQQKDKEGNTNPFSCLILFWVDDILCVTYTKEEMDLLIQSFEGELPITVSDLDQYLGMQCTHDQEAGVITVNNNELILKTAVLLGLDPEHSNGVNLPFEAGVRLSKDDCPQTSADKADQAKWVSDYRTGVGVLLWIATMTRHDCAYSASQLSRFVSNPGKAHFKRLKQTFRYLLKTPEVQLEFRCAADGDLVHGAPAINPLVLRAASDATWGTEEDGAFYCGWVLSMCGTPVIARSKKWKSAAISSTESEIIAMSECCRDIRNVRGFLAEIGFAQKEPTTLWADNSSAIINGEEPTRTSDKTKHIRIRDFFCRECVANKEVVLEKANGNFLSADALTKALAGTKFKLFRPILQGSSSAKEQTANPIHVQCVTRRETLQWNSPPCYCHRNGNAKQARRACDHS